MASSETSEVSASESIARNSSTFPFSQGKYNFSYKSDQGGQGKPEIDPRPQTTEEYQTVCNVLAMIQVQVCKIISVLYN